MDFDQLEVIIFLKTKLNTKLDRKEVYFQLKVTITHLNRILFYIWSFDLIFVNTMIQINAQ